MKTAIVTGVTGQDGAYLVSLLLKKGYKVHGTYRRTSSVNFWRLDALGVKDNDNLHLVEYDITDLSSSIRLLETAEANEVYNLAAQSFVGVSFDQPHTTSKITGLGVLNLLESIRLVDKNIKFYQASTSEMFGLVQTIPQTEKTPFYPRSPYGVAKLYAHWMTINYRESYGIFGTSGILFNHESPLRGKEFVTRKITDSIAKIVLGKQRNIQLGNLDSQRDWGYAEEYVDGMWRMLQHTMPDTFVLATNKTVTVRDFVLMAFRSIGVEIEFSGLGEAEQGVISAIDGQRMSLFCECHHIDIGQVVVKINPAFYRPAEVDILIGDSSKALTVLGWMPSTNVEDLCAMMVEADIKRNIMGFSY